MRIEGKHIVHADGTPISADEWREKKTRSVTRAQSQQIRQMTRDGKWVMEIVAEVGVTPRQVTTVRSAMGRGC